MLKIGLSVLLDTAPPSELRQKAVPLKDKVDHAVECIDYGLPNKQQAIEFLRKVHNALLQVTPRPTVEQQLMIDRIAPVLGEYGTEHLNTGKDE